MGVPIDGVTRRDRTGSSLATDKGGGQAEVSVEGAERDMD